MVEAVDGRGGTVGRRPKVDRRTARDEGVGLGRAAVVGQGGVEDVGQGGRVGAVAGSVEVARAGRKAVEGIGVALAAVAEDVEGVGRDCAGLVMISSPLLVALLPEIRLRVSVSVPPSL